LKEVEEEEKKNESKVLSRNGISEDFSLCENLLMEGGLEG